MRHLGKLLTSAHRGGGGARELVTHQGRFTVIEVAVPAQDSLFVVRTRSGSLARDVAGSLRLLPGDETTVPELASGATGGAPGKYAAPDAREVSLRLRLAGLEPKIEYDANADVRHWSGLTIDKPTGEVVARGSVVTIRYSYGGRTS